MSKKKIQFSGKNLSMLYAILVFAEGGIHGEVGGNPDITNDELDEIEKVLKFIVDYKAKIREKIHKHEIYFYVDEESNNGA